MNIALQDRGKKQETSPIPTLHTYKLQPNLYQVLRTGKLTGQV